jgi:hypothetical protein
VGERCSCFVLVLAGAVGVVHWYAYSTYYLGLDGRTVAVYQGQPKGVLWFKPVKVLDTSYSLAQILPANRPAMRATISEPTLTAAINYAAYLHSQWVTAFGHHDHHHHDATPRRPPRSKRRGRRCRGG